MKRTAIVYGVIVGLVIIGSAILAITLGVLVDNTWLGYLIMFVAFTAIFFAIKQYRDQQLGGVIRFGTAAWLGLGIAVVASIVYVAVWELYLYVTDYGFMNEYANVVLGNRKAEGASASELSALTQQMEQLKASYSNPLIRLPMTFLEIFPVGLLVALVSAAVLRNRKGAAAAA